MSLESSSTDPFSSVAMEPASTDSSGGPASQEQHQAASQQQEEASQPSSPNDSLAEAMPGLSVAAPADFAGEDDSVLTPRSFAQTQAQQHSVRASATTSSPSSSPPASSPLSPSAFLASHSFSHLAGGADDPLAPPFQCMLGESVLQGEGLDTHTRYELNTRFKRSLVEASAAAIEKQAAQKRAAEAAEASEAEEKGSAPAPAPSPSNATGAITWLPMQVPSTARVQRRYGEFVFLQTLLSKTYPSFLIPCLPPKSVMDRFNVDFLAHRRRGLQRFLNDLAEMPLPLSEDPVIQQFLLCTPRQWTVIEAAQRATHGLGAAKAVGSSMWNLGSKLYSAVVRPVAADDPHAHDAHWNACALSVGYHTQLHLQYEHTTAQVGNIIKGERDVADAWAALYKGYDESSDSAEQQARIQKTRELLGLDFGLFLPLTQRIATQSRAATRSATRLHDLLAHSTGMITQVQSLLQRRHALSTATHAADADAKVAASQLENIKRRVALGEKSAADESKIASHSAHCAAVFADKSRELVSFHSTAAEQIQAYTQRRRKEMKEIIVEFAREQVKQEEALAAHFQALLTQLEQKQ